MVPYVSVRPSAGPKESLHNHFNGTSSSTLAEQLEQSETQWSLPP